MKIVVADELPASALALLRAETSWVIDARSGRRPDELAADLGDADGIQQANRLRFCSRRFGHLAADPHGRIERRHGFLKDHRNFTAAHPAPLVFAKRYQIFSGSDLAGLRRRVRRQKSLAGYAGAKLLQRTTGTGVEVVVLTWWESLDAIRAFAGDDLETAVVADAAAALLTDYDRRVRHYEVVLQDLDR